VGKFLSEIKGQPVGNSGSIDFILAKLGEADGRDLIDALNDPNIRPTQIIKALQARQIKLSPSVITRYRAANVITQ
jgi:hypothetical protein